MSLRKAATSVPSAPLLSCVLRLSVASHAAVCAPALGASLTFCQRSVRLRCRPAERLGGLGDRCERSVHVGSADPMPNPSSPFMSQRGPTRNVSSPHHHHHHHHHRTFGHKRTTCSELSGGRKKKNNQAIISHTTAPEMSSAAPRRASSHSSSAGLTSVEPVSSREHQRRGERVPPARTSSQTHKVEALLRFIHPPVAPEPSLPMKLVTGRGDSSNAIFVTPSWDSLSPLLLLRAQPAQPPQMS